jgi:hypothetical protein
VLDLNEVAWRNKHLFLSKSGTCKMWQPKEGK